MGRERTGTCKDRLIFEQDPHAVIEGVMIGALAVGRAQRATSIFAASTGIFWSIMQKAIRDGPTPEDLLARIFLAAGRDLGHLLARAGAGAYEVGEESALMESLEGKRGIPRIRPPFPAVVDSGATDGHQQCRRRWLMCLTLFLVAGTGTRS